MTDAAVLRIGDEATRLPVFGASEGEGAVELRALRSRTEEVPLAPGHASRGPVAPLGER
jgi:hypothetical protein